MYNPDHKIPAATTYLSTADNELAVWPSALSDGACRKALTYKDISDPALLKTVRECDLSRMHYALTQLLTFDVDQALQRFFGQDFGNLPGFMQNNGPHRLNHLGMETYTPLDLWLDQADHWMAELSQRINHPVTLLRTTRFPSSQALQNRVGAGVEILCVWLQINQETLMMELFDIARPVPEAIRYHNLAAPDSFNHDLIWHYAIDLESTSRVDEIHERFIELTLGLSDYRLAYTKPVVNRHDNSYHTKIIHQTLGMELEFATHTLV